AAAGLIEIDDDVRLISFKIRWRIVEGQMAVFADADEGHVNRRRDDLFADAFANLIRIGVAVEQMAMRYSRRSDQVLHQLLAKARRMRDWQAGVFIEVEHLDFRPVNARRLCQSVQKLELRSARGGDDARPPALGDCAVDSVRGLPGGGFAQLD